MNRWMNGEKDQDAHDPEVAIQRHKIIRTLKHKRTQIHNAAESSVAYGIPMRMFQTSSIFGCGGFSDQMHIRMDFQIMLSLLGLGLWVIQSCGLMVR